MLSFLNKNNNVKLIFIVLISSVLTHLAIANELDALLAQDSLYSVQALPTPDTMGLSEINDDELKDVTGQALFEINQRTGSDGMQFLRFLFNAKVQTNLNVDYLNLGDDIIFDNVSFQGDNTGSTGASGSGPQSYAELTRPYLELAMENFDSETARRLVGMRLGAESANGLITIGSQDPDPSCNLFTGGRDGICDDTGISSLNGYVAVGSFDVTVGISEVNFTNYFNQRTNNPVTVINGEEFFTYTYSDGITTALGRVHRYANNISNTPYANTQTQRDSHFNDNIFYSSQGQIQGAPLPADFQGIKDYTIDGHVGIDCDITFFGPSCPGLAELQQGFNYYTQGIILTDTVTLPDIVNEPTEAFAIYTNNGSTSSYPIQINGLPVADIGYILGNGQDNQDGRTAYLAWDDGTLSSPLGNDSLNVDLGGGITGLDADTTVNQELRFFHNLPLSGRTSLSFQAQPIRWPGSTVPHLPGYFIAVEDEVQIGSLELTNDIELGPDEYRQLEVAIERGIFGGPLVLNGTVDNVGDGLNSITNGADIILESSPGSGQYLDVDTTILVTQSNLPVGPTQTPVNNCYGGIDCF